MTADFVEWEAIIEAVDWNVYRNDIPHPTGNVLKFQECPPDSLNGKVLWHHLTFDHQIGNRQKFFQFSVRGELAGKDLRWYRDCDDTPDDRVQNLQKGILDLNNLLLSDGGPFKLKIRTHIQVPACDCPRVDLDSATFEGRFYVQNTYFLPNFLTHNGRALNPNDDGSLGIIENLSALYHIPEVNFESRSFISEEDFSRHLINTGDRLGVFRKRLHKRRKLTLNTIEDDVVWLRSKAYRYSPEPSELEDLSEKNLGESKLVASMTRNGVIEVTHENHFSGTFKTVMGTLLQYTTPDPDGEEVRHCRTVATKFVRCILDKIPALQGTEVELDIQKRGHSVTQRWIEGFNNAVTHLRPVGVLDLDQSEIKEQRERQRYIIMHLERVTCDVCHKTVSPSRLAEHLNFSTAFLEGHLVYQPGDATKLLLPSVARYRNKQENHGTLDEEIVVIGFERCFIYHQPDTLLHSGNIADSYETYWRCIIRAFQHFLAVKTAVHLLEAWTVKATRHVPDLIKEFEKKKKERTDIDAKLADFAKDMEGFAKYVPPIREISIPSSAFRASFVVEKFQYLGEHIFHLPEILSNIQQNITELSSALQYYSEKKRQVREASIGRFLTLMGLALAILAAFVAAPSFLQSVGQLCPGDGIIQCVLHPGYRNILRWYFTALLIVHLIGTLFYGYYCFKRKPHDRTVWVAIGLLIIAFIGFYFWRYVLPEVPGPKERPIPVSVVAPSPVQNE